MRKRLLSLFTALVLIASAMSTTVSAAGNEAGWIELLEYSSVQSDGTNTFAVTTSGSFTIPIYGQHRLRKVDILLWNYTGHRPTSAYVTVDQTTGNLDILAIGSNLTRVVGYIPNAWYEELTVNFKKGNTVYAEYEVLSCKVTGIGVQEFEASYDVYLEDYGQSGYFGKYDIPFYVEDSGGNWSDGEGWLARVEVYDWEKYDSLSIWGSVTSASVESIRCSLGTTALDYNINYIDAESYESAVEGDPTFWETSQWGKYLYNVTIDLSNVDRSLVSTPLYIYFTGSYDITVPGAFNCQYVNGSVNTADTTAVSWWMRFTDFMRSLLPSSSPESNGFENEAGNKADEMEDLNEQLQNVTRPNIEDVETDLEDYVSKQELQATKDGLSSLMNNQLVVSTLMISLTMSLVAYILYGKR